MKFNEAQLEQAFINLLEEEGFTYEPGNAIHNIVGEPKEAYGLLVHDEVLLRDELAAFLKTCYAQEGITDSEVQSIIKEVSRFPASDLYESNKVFMKMVSDGFLFKREDHTQKDLFIQLIDYSEQDQNSYKIVNQMAIEGFEVRIPDLILFINGMPLVVFEFKSAIREEATLFQAYEQLTNRYRKAIPELFKYNAFCVISDGVNNKAGAFFSKYEFFYAWRKITGNEQEVDGISSMYSLVQGMLQKDRLRDIIRNFIYIPDTSKKEDKIVCRYPQYYAANKLLENIKVHQKPHGDGKGGTYFGATGCGKKLHYALSYALIDAR